MESVEELRRLVCQLDAVLREPREEPIHQFLEQHPDLLDFLLWPGFLLAKYRLADAFVPDFLFVGLDSLSQGSRLLLTFVEIERANEVLFTKSGDPTAFLTHAIKQTQDWKRWVKDNRTYVHTSMQRLLSARVGETDESIKNAFRGSVTWLGPELQALRAAATNGFDERYLVIAGRRETLRLDDRLALTQMNQDLRDTRIITYDVIADALLRHLEIASGDRSWRDLADGL